MKEITVPTDEQLSPATLLIFEQIRKRLGKVPYLYAVVGYSEFALKAFAEFEENLQKGAFTAKESEAIALVVSEINGCKYCLSAHIMATEKRGFTTDETLCIRKAEVND